jgi:hypothetical protein
VLRTWTFALRRLASIPLTCAAWVSRIIAPADNCGTLGALNLAVPALLQRLLWIRISLYNNDIWTPISINSILYYNTDILALFIQLYYISVLLLFRCLKDLNITCSSALFKTTFIALYYLTLFILTLIMDFNLF